MEAVAGVEEQAQDMLAAANKSDGPTELSVVMPCLNEAETLRGGTRDGVGHVAEHGSVERSSWPTTGAPMAQTRWRQASERGFQWRASGATAMP